MNEINRIKYLQFNVWVWSSIHKDQDNKPKEIEFEKNLAYEELIEKMPQILEMYGRFHVRIVSEIPFTYEDGKFSLHDVIMPIEAESWACERCKTHSRNLAGVVPII